MIEQDPRSAIRRLNLIGGGILLALVCGVGGWAYSTELSGAVIAHGNVVVDSDVKSVQHPTGGIVGKLNVRNGDLVQADDILVQLDDTTTRASLAIVMNRIDQLQAREARLEAERDGTSKVSFPEELISRRGDQRVDAIMAGEQRLFQLRATARAGQIAQLTERVSQLDDELGGLRGQLAAKRREIALVTKELIGVQELWDKNLISIQRVTALERDAARLEGERGQLVAAIAQVGGRQTEVNLQIIQIDQNLRSEVAAELRDVQSQIAELGERRTAAEDQLRRIDIRAPQEGVVHRLAVHTIGGVIQAGETIMLIVPVDELSIEVRIAPQDIDSAYNGQPATVRFPAFNQRTTPEVVAIVTTISPDLLTDELSASHYYSARLSIDPDELSKLEKVLSPGMPVEAFLQTEGRTVISYLMKPLRDQVVRAFREE